jgi:hypothetical protein
LFAHAYFGTSFGPAVTFQNVLISIPSIHVIASIHMGLALLVAFVTCLLAWMLSRNIKPVDHILWVIGVAICFGVLCTLPIALTTKYQQWSGSCSLSAGGIGCAYIDSRIAYLGYISALALLSIGVLTAPSSLVKKMYVRAIIAIALGLIGGYTYLHNWAVSEQMRQYIAPWQTADQLACKDYWMTLGDSILLEKIDPGHVLLYHPDFDRPAYWRAYLLNRAATLKCP